jgi:hypothetical protein
VSPVSPLFVSQHSQYGDMERDTSSPEPMSIHLCLPESPNKEPSYKMRKNIRSLSTEPHTDGRPTYNSVQPGSPRGSSMKLLSLPQCHAAFSTIPSTLTWVDQSPISQRESYKPQKGIPSTPVTASHVTQGRVEYKSTIPQGTDEGLDLWEAYLI